MPCHQPGWGCGMLRLCFKAQGRKLGGRGEWIGRGVIEKRPRVGFLMLWPIAQVLDSWPHQRHNRCKTSQLVSKWEKCQLWFLLPKKWKINNYHSWASLVAQWLRICLPMQGTRVRALVWEDPTCLGATKPVCHNYWACALEPVSHNYWARMPQLLKPARLEPVLCTQQEKPLQWEARATQRRVSPAHRN